MKIRMNRSLASTIIALAFSGSVATVASAGPAPAPKVDICHWDADQQRYFVINVSANAQPGHLKHGDSMPATYWADTDDDGFGDPGGTSDRCPQHGLVDNKADCNDADGLVNPDATEAIYDGVDNDC